MLIMKKKKNPFSRKMFGLDHLVLILLINIVSLSCVVSCPDKDEIAKVDVKTQETSIKKAFEECLLKMIDSENTNKDNVANNKCHTTFDLVLCWPEAYINETIYLPCPNYIDNFNIKNKVEKRCQLDPITNRANWSKSNYSLCSKSESVCNSFCNIENHLIYINIIRISGYVISMVALILSIIILLRPKLRCPRNYVHINLFIAFAVRTVLVMLIDYILNTKPSLNFVNDSDISQKTDGTYIACKIMMSLFRYSGSVYHMAIFSEAIYLVLLLKFPYYNESKGSKFCIIISWTLPILWMIPWIFVRAYVHNYWCWQTESNFNLILKIPHTVVLIANISCAVFIIRILYSKMRVRNLSREKLMKYRRLAKSILILIPIFGLHFTFFAWLPYASLVNLKIGDCFEIVCTYIETSFNAFQGLVVAITCCFIHREVRIEFILYGCQLLKKINCIQSLQCMECLDSDYIRQLRYLYHETRGASIGISNLNDTMMQFENKRQSNQIYNQSFNGNGEKNPMLADIPELSNGSRRKKLVDVSNGPRKSIDTLKRPSSYSITSSFDGGKKCCCCCLFSDKKNDFFNDSGSSTRRSNRKNILFTKLKAMRQNSEDINNNTNNNNNSTLTSASNSILRRELLANLNTTSSTFENNQNLTNGNCVQNLLNNSAITDENEPNNNTSINQINTTIATTDSSNVNNTTSSSSNHVESIKFNKNISSSLNFTPTNNYV